MIILQIRNLYLQNLHQIDLKLTESYTPLFLDGIRFLFDQNCFKGLEMNENVLKLIFFRIYFSLRSKFFKLKNVSRFEIRFSIKYPIFKPIRRIVLEFWFFPFEKCYCEKSTRILLILCTAQTLFHTRCDPLVRQGKDA